MLGVNKVLFLIVIHLFYSITCFQHINFLCSTPIWLSAVKIEVKTKEEGEIEEELPARICNNEWKFSAHKQIKGRNDGKIDSDDNDNGGRLPFPHFDTKHKRKEFLASFFSSSSVFAFAISRKWLLLILLGTFPISESVENFYLLFQVIFTSSLSDK